MTTRLFAFVRSAALTGMLVVLACDANAATPGAHAKLSHGPPIVQPELARPVAAGVTIIPDPRIDFVPNVGLIEGRDAVLVVDSGLGPENGRRIWDFVRQRAGQRKIYLTSTHCHPEHAFGAQAFKPGATFILNAAQAQELAEKGPGLLELFRHFGPQVDAALAHTSLIAPDETYSGEKTLDLGGRTVILRELPAHTRGDQIIFVPGAGVVFAGDLIEERFFPVAPDTDARGAAWIEVTRAIEALKPKIVVPGHGALGDVGLVRARGAYLLRVQDAVQAGVRSGLDQDALIKELTPKLNALHPDWDNAHFIPNEIAVFYAEATGKPVRMPGFQ